MEESAAKDERTAFQNLQTFWLGESSEPFSEKVLELAYEPLHVGGMDDGSASASTRDECAGTSSNCL
jgi:hypothetical protein